VYLELVCFGLLVLHNYKFIATNIIQFFFCLTNKQLRSMISAYYLLKIAKVQKGFELNTKLIKLFIKTTI